LIGEIRDGETAEAALKIASSGHAVFSTLHTEDSVGVVQRLIDMGIQASRLSKTLRSAMGQRLIPTINMELFTVLHPATATTPPEYGASPKYLKEVDILPAISELLLHAFAGQVPVYLPRDPEEVGEQDYKPYKGRAPILEILTVEEDLAQLIMDEAKERDIKAKAMKDPLTPYVPMELHALLKVLRGETTLELAVSVIGKGWTRSPLYRKAAIELVQRYVDCGGQKEDDDILFPPAQSASEVPLAA
jgi:type II secretory ATPase GspE/PulE/Tfp pilus assembly ATPase PilB-like protein